MLAVVLSVLTLSIWTFIISSLVIASFIYYCRLYQWSRSQRSIINIERGEDNKWIIFLHNGEQKSELVLIESVVTQYFVLLSFRVPTRWRRSTIIIMNDAVEDESFRQLRVYCRAPNAFQ